jgi:hypothetical protein
MVKLGSGSTFYLGTHRGDPLLEVISKVHSRERLCIEHFAQAPQLVTSL